MDFSTQKIDELLRAEDIEDLLSSGAPEDEYKYEAEEISKSIARLAETERTEKNVVAIISLIWAQSFNRSPEEMKRRLPAFKAIAQRLIAQIRPHTY